MEEEGMEDEGETVEEGEEEQGLEDEDVEEEGMEDEGKVEVGVLPEDDKEETSSDEEIAIKRQKKQKAVIESDEESEVSSRQSKDGRQIRSKKETPARRKSASISHHVDRRCMVGHGCSYVGPNLKRHLTNVHVKRGHLLLEQVEKFFSMGSDGHKKRGPARKSKSGKKMKGRVKCWCPQANCHYLGPYLPQHLVNRHRMKPSSRLYKTTLKIARKYKGLQDEVEDMVLLVRAGRKRAQADTQADESDSDVVPPTPKGKAVVGSLSASVSSAGKKQTTPSKTSAPELAETPYDAGEGPSTSSDPVAGPSPSKPSEISEAHSDQEDSCYMMSADFFQEKNPKTNRHKWLCSFYNYLFTPTAGFKKDRNRLQHASQVKRLIEETDPKGDDIKFLVEDEGKRAWVDWVAPNLQKKKPGTLKSYLTSFEVFLEFVSKKGKRPHLPVLDMEVKNKLFDLCNASKKWRRCITKETKSQKWDRYLDESCHLLTNEEVQDILTSKPAVDGRAALVAASEAEDSADLSMKQYCDARDYLIVSLTRAVGTRPAALENASLEMFCKALWDDGKRKKVMLVSSHKREEDGPAPIPMNPDTEYLMAVQSTLR